jgi:hypothetical protein
MDLFLLFGILPTLSILLLFIPDVNEKRKNQLNKLIAFNVFVFLSPILLAKLLTLTDGGDIANENTGGDAAFWLYLILFPVCVIAFIILLVFKIKNFKEPNKN